MTPLQLTALLPLILATLTSVVVMLTIAFKRHHRLVAGITVAGLNLALLSLIPVIVAANGQAIELTPLLIVDGYAIFYMGLVLITALGVLTLCHAYFEGYSGNREELYLLLSMATLGALVMVCSRHFAGFFIGLELLSVPLYAMVAYPVRDSRALEGGVKYLVLSGAASAFMLFGIALIYAETGALGFAEIAGKLAMGRQGILLAGAAMILVGIGFKLSAVPFHLWTSDVYEAAPAPVAAFLATVSKAAMFVVVYRLFVNVGLFRQPATVEALTWLAVASMLVGNLLALRQDNVKRILAYSSIAQFGYLLVALILAGGRATEAAGIFLLSYLVTALGVFGVMTLVSSPMKDRDVEHIEQFRGLFWKRPYLASIMTTLLLSLAGIPLTAGFIGKFYVIAIGVDARQWLLMGAVIVGSAIGLYYYLRVMIMMFQPIPVRERVSEPLNWVQNAGGAMLMLAMALMLVIGVYPEPFLDLIRASVLVVR
ncbi:MAG: NADH-quinone oxidoreductase subunit NuoN [Stagnimonas sp.]|nr:NADH-quinone oxidoreductase subunit NuoN [Stagnimonas sp.]